MPNFVKLTHKQGNPVWINPAYVETVLTADGATRVIMSGTSGRFDVQDSLEAVMEALGAPIESTPESAEAAPSAVERPSRRPRTTRR